MCVKKEGGCKNHLADVELPLYTTLPQTQVLTGLNGVQWETQRC